MNLQELFSAGKLHVGRDGKSHSQRWCNQPFCCHNTWSRGPTHWGQSLFFRSRKLVIFWQKIQIPNPQIGPTLQHHYKTFYPRNHFCLSSLQRSLLAPCHHVVEKWWFFCWVNHPSILEGWKTKKKHNISTSQLPWKNCLFFTLYFPRFKPRIPPVCHQPTNLFQPTKRRSPSKTFIHFSARQPHFFDLTTHYLHPKSGKKYIGAKTAPFKYSQSKRSQALFIWVQQ